MRMLMSLAILGATMLALPGPAAAEPPSTASGTFTLVNLTSRIITLERTADGNQILSVRHETPLYAGGLAGTATITHSSFIQTDRSTVRELRRVSRAPLADAPAATQPRLRFKVPSRRCQGV